MLNRIPTYVIFLTVVSTVYFFIHFFVYRCLVRELVQDSGLQKALKWFFIVNGISFFVIQALNPVFKMRVLNFYSGTWLGVIAISFFIFLLQWVPAKIFPEYAKRSAILSLIIIGIIAGVSLVNGNLLPRVKRMTIPMKNLPVELKGFKVVHLSDLHIEAFNSPHRLARIVDKVNRENPDIVVITGDLIDGNVLKTPELGVELGRIRAKYGKFVVLGNHDYYGGIKSFYELVKVAGFKVLINEMVTAAGSIQVAGLDDNEGVRRGTGGPDLEKALKGADPSKPLILLYHRPFLFDEAVKKGVGLQLSGHTHAGQFPPMDIIVWVYYKYPWGLFEENGSYIYTSNGTDVWRTPMRFLSVNEIAVFTLTPPGNSQL